MTYSPSISTTIVTEAEAEAEAEAWLNELDIPYHAQPPPSSRSVG